MISVLEIRLRTDRRTESIQAADALFAMQRSAPAVLRLVSSSAESSTESQSDMMACAVPVPVLGTPVPQPQSMQRGPSWNPDAAHGTVIEQQQRTPAAVAVEPPIVAALRAGCGTKTSEPCSPGATRELSTDELAGCWATAACLGAHCYGLQAYGPDALLQNPVPCVCGMPSRARISGPSAQFSISSAMAVSRAASCPRKGGGVN